MEKSKYTSTPADSPLIVESQCVQFVRILSSDFSRRDEKIVKIVTREIVVVVVVVVRQVKTNAHEAYIVRRVYAYIYIKEVYKAREVSARRLFCSTERARAHEAGKKSGRSRGEALYI